MLPSPAMAAGRDRTAPPRFGPDAPKPVLPEESLSEHDISQSDFDQHILLSPPPSTVTTDPFEEDTRNQPTRESPDLVSVTQRNLAAHELNSQWSVQPSQGRQTPPASEPIATGLQIKTDLNTSHSSLFSASVDSDTYLRHSISTSSIPKRTPSIRAALHTSAGSLSPGSALSSPQLAAMLSITPLPSPVEAGRDPWRINYRTRSRGSSLANAEAPPQSRPSTLSPPSSPPKRKAYNGLHTSPGDSHAKLSSVTADKDSLDQSRDRSVSDYVPNTILFAKPRHVAVSGNALNQDPLSAQSAMHREEYLAVQRGFSIPSPALKTPSRYVSPLDSNAETVAVATPQLTKSKTQFYTAQSVTTGHLRRYKLIRQLGQGTFSKVFLAVRQVDNDDDGIDYAGQSTSLDGVRIRSRRLVAVKVVEQGPAGGADAERVEVSLRREVEVLKAVNHPSLVHLKAVGTEEDCSLLVLNYCPGGDLFEVASSQLDVLVPSLVRRIFAELVSAVRYLHQKFIVHRDIKLESESGRREWSAMLITI
jgi:protein-serine/threonine kinase